MDLKRLFLFALAGGSGFVVDAGLTEGLVYAGLSPYLARIIAIAAAMTTTYAINRTLTWKSASRGSAAVGEAGRYLAVAIVTALVNYLVFSSLIWLIPTIRPALAVALAVAVSMVLSYQGYQRFAFGKSTSEGRS